jgi:sugar phosphate permease
MDESALPRTRWTEVFGLLRNARYNLLVWGYTAQTFAIGAFGIWGPTFLHRVHGLALGQASTIFGAMLAGAGLVATLAGGLAATRLRRRTPAGYAWLMAGALVVAVPFSLFAVMTHDATLSLVALGLSIFFLFLPTGPVTTQLIEIVPVHLRASGVALCIFITHLCGDWQSPALVGTISDAVARSTHSAAEGLQKGVLILPLVLMIGAGLWGALVYRTRVATPTEP